MRKYLLLLILFSFQQISWAQQSWLVGATMKGGKGFGTIFHYKTGDTTLSYVNQLDGTPGAHPQYNAMTLESNGKILGLLQYGGIYGRGIIFEYDCSTNSYSKKVDFIQDGQPIGGLALAPNGKYYGCARNSIFEYDITTNLLTQKIYFNPINASTMGSYPAGSLAMGSNGKFYGMTMYGGANGVGVLFEYDYSTNTFTKKIDLSTSIGSVPHGNLILATNGLLYGLTTTGGTNNKGVIFSYNSSTNTYTNLFDFGGNNGETPYGALTQANNGKLYGNTYEGGFVSAGVVFEYDISTSTFAKKLDAAWFGGLSKSPLLKAANGKLYGFGQSDLFSYNYNNNIGTTLIQYEDIFLSKGGDSWGNQLIQANNGKIYGFTNDGGNAGDGVLFELDTLTKAMSVKVNFGAANGEYINSNLYDPKNGKLYGNTVNGGLQGAGAIFSYNPNSKSYSKLMEFSDSFLYKGIWPKSNLSYASTHSFYGLTSQYGYNNVSPYSYGGTIFEYNFQNNTLSKIHDFDSGAAGGFLPLNSGLTLANSGKYYGVTYMGGTPNHGTIFQYDKATAHYTKFYEFGSNNYIEPQCELTLANNGKLYGIANQGGTCSGGIYEVDPTTLTYTEKYNLCNSNSTATPLMQASNGKMYVATQFGGTYGKGEIGEYNYTTNTFTGKFYSFLDSMGENPQGKIIEACNGKIYGVTAAGGDYKCGVLYEYDFVNNVFKKKVSFKPQDGISPYSLTEFIFTQIAPTLSVSQNNICKNDSVRINIVAGSLGSSMYWQWYKGNCTTGTAIDTGISIKVKPLATTTYSVRSEGGCVPVGTCVSVTIIVRPVSYATINKTTCDNHPFYFNGHNLNVSGTYYDTLLNYVGCDSFVTLNLTVLSTSSYSFNQTVCYNHPYNFNGTILNTSGIYHDTIPNHFGCDSFITLNLTVKPISNYSFNQTICNNHPYYFNNHWLNVSGNYKDTLVNYVGCDSFVNLNLTVKPISNYSFTHKICSYQFYNFNNHYLNVSGTYLDTLVNHVGCDSFLTLTLIVLPDSVLLTKYICPGSPYNFNGTLISIPGTYRDSLTNQLGCDSIVVLHLFNGFTTASNITTTICFNHPFQVGTKFYNQTGTYHDTIPNRFQCDSFVTLHLTVKPISSNTFNKTICKNNPFYFHQQWLNVSGVYHDTLTNFVGCDSFVTLNLTVKDTALVILNETICNDHPYFFHHQYLNQSGTYDDTLQNYLGCDSTVVLHLQVNVSSSSFVTDSVCSNRAYHFNQLYLDSSGIFHDTIPNHSGCDSTITLNLTMYPQHPRITNVLGKLTAFGWGYDKLTWINCDNKQFVSSANPFNVNESGNYAVVVEQGNCSDTSACLYVDIDCHLLATPNPAKDNIHIKIKCGDKAFHLVLTDVLGRALIKQEIKNQDELELLRNGLAAGIYFLYLYNEHDVKMVQKMVWE